jgi:hypothetical protein
MPCYYPDQEHNPCGVPIRAAAHGEPDAPAAGDLKLPLLKRYSGHRNTTQLAKQLMTLLGSLQRRSCEEVPGIDCSVARRSEKVLPPFLSFACGMANLILRLFERAMHGLAALRSHRSSRTSYHRKIRQPRQVAAVAGNVRSVRLSGGTPGPEPVDQPLIGPQFGGTPNQRLDIVGA